MFKRILIPIIVVATLVICVSVYYWPVRYIENGEGMTVQCIVNDDNISHTLIDITDKELIEELCSAIANVSFQRKFFSGGSITTTGKDDYFFILSKNTGNYLSLHIYVDSDGIEEFYKINIKGKRMVAIKGKDAMYDFIQKYILQGGYQFSSRFFSLSNNHR